MGGVTLIELLVALTLLGLIVGVSTVSISTLRLPRETTRIVELQRARVAAIESGAPRTAHGALFLPDGRAIGEAVDPLTGAPRAQ